MATENNDTELLEDYQLKETGRPGVDKAIAAFHAGLTTLVWQVRAALDGGANEIVDAMIADSSNTTEITNLRQENDRLRVFETEVQQLRLVAQRLRPFEEDVGRLTGDLIATKGNVEKLKAELRQSYKKVDELQKRLAEMSDMEKFVRARADNEEKSKQLVVAENKKLLEELDRLRQGASSAPPVIDIPSDQDEEFGDATETAEKTEGVPAPFAFERNAQGSPVSDPEPELLTSTAPAPIPAPAATTPKVAAPAPAPAPTAASTPVPAPTSTSTTTTSASTPVPAPASDAPDAQKEKKEKHSDKDGKEEKKEHRRKRDDDEEEETEPKKKSKKSKTSTAADSEADDEEAEESPKKKKKQSKKVKDMDIESENSLLKELMKQQEIRMAMLEQDHNEERERLGKSNQLTKQHAVEKAKLQLEFAEEIAKIRGPSILDLAKMLPKDAAPKDPAVEEKRRQMDARIAAQRKADEAKSDDDDASDDEPVAAPAPAPKSPHTLIPKKKAPKPSQEEAAKALVGLQDAASSSSSSSTKEKEKEKATDRKRKETAEPEKESGSKKPRAAGVPTELSNQYSEGVCHIEVASQDAGAGILKLATTAWGVLTGEEGLEISPKKLTNVFIKTQEALLSIASHRDFVSRFNAIPDTTILLDLGTYALPSSVTPKENPKVSLTFALRGGKALNYVVVYLTNGGVKYLAHGFDYKADVKSPKKGLLAGNQMVLRVLSGQDNIDEAENSKTIKSSDLLHCIGVRGPNAITFTNNSKRETRFVTMAILVNITAENAADVYTFLRGTIVREKNPIMPGGTKLFQKNQGYVTVASQIPVSGDHDEAAKRMFDLCRPVCGRNVDTVLTKLETDFAKQIKPCASPAFIDSMGPKPKAASSSSSSSSGKGKEKAESEDESESEAEGSSSDEDDDPNTQEEEDDDEGEH